MTRQRLGHRAGDRGTAAMAGVIALVMLQAVVVYECAVGIPVARPKTIRWVNIAP